MERYTCRREIGGGGEVPGRRSRGSRSSTAVVARWWRLGLEKWGRGEGEREKWRRWRAGDEGNKAINGATFGGAKYFRPDASFGAFFLPDFRFLEIFCASF